MEEAPREPRSLVTGSALVSGCLDGAACNYGSGLLLMRGRAEALQLAMTGTLLEGKTSLSGTKPIVIYMSNSIKTREG